MLTKNAHLRLTAAIPAANTAPATNSPPVRATAPPPVVRGGVREPVIFKFPVLRQGGYKYIRLLIIMIDNDKKSVDNIT